MATAINAPLNVNFQNGSQLTREIQGSVDRVKFNNLGGEKGFRSLSQPLGRLTGQADEFTKSLDAANARVLAFGASVGIVNAVANAFKSLVNSTIEVEKAITAISVVGDQFNGKTKQLSQGLFNIAKTTGQSFGEVSKAALEFSRQGLNLEDTLQRTKDALVLTRTTGLDAAKSVDGLTAAVNAFAKAGLSTTQVLNKLAAVDQAFAVSSADLIEAFQRTGAVAQQAGVSFDELAGIVTALQTETSRGGAVIGNALKTIFSRLQDTSTLTQLKDLGVAVQDLQGNLLPARQILQNLAGDVQGLSKVTQAGVFKDVAGTFQLNQLVSLVNDLNKEQSISAAATRKSAGATNEAYIANEKLGQSLDAVLNKVVSTGKQLGSILGEIGLTDNLKELLDWVNSFIEGVNNILQGDSIGSNFAKGFVKGIGAVLSGPGLGIFLAIIAKLSYDLLKFGTQSLKTFFGISKAASDQKQIQESIVQVLLRNRSVLKEIENTQGGQNAQALKFLGILNQQAAAMKDVQGLASNIAGKAYSAGYRQTERGLARRSAGGYLPAQEASDVRRGVGGASPSSKVVSIPNFAFGGGKRGTMVANTSEYIVPNYAGGGSAIFNQDMVKTMGLPAGAKKINAAGGFIPNFASETSVPKDVSEKYALITNQASDTKKGITFSHTRKDGETVPYIADVYGIDTSKFKGSPELYERRFSAKKLQARYTDLAIKDAKNFAEKAIGLPLSPVSIQNLTNAGSVPSLAGTIFETAIQSILTDDELINLMSEKGGANARFDFIGPATSKIGPFFGIEKNIPYYLEAKSTLSPNAKKSFAAKIDSVERGNTAPAQEISNIASIKAQWLAYQNRENKRSGFEDFNSIARSLNIDPTKADKASTAKKINKIFGTASTGYIPNFADLDGDGVVTQRDGFYTRLKSAAKKYSKNPAVDFVLNQIIQSTLGLPEGVEVMEIVRACDQALEAMKPEDELNKILRQKSAAKKSQKRQSFLKSYYNSSSGYVPNFAAAALQQAIAREKSAGLSNSQIYVDQNSSLKSPLNPMGLMVANTRDEPFGGIQGISRARTEGANPKTYGAANGFVPNYAVSGGVTPQAGFGPVPSTTNQSVSNNQNQIQIQKQTKSIQDSIGSLISLQFASSALTGILSEAGETAQKFGSALGGALIGIQGIKELGKTEGGVSFGNLRDFKSSKSSREITAGFSRLGTANRTRSLSTLASGLGLVTKGLLRFAPLIGQVVLGFDILNGVLKAFGVDIVKIVTDKFRGVNDAGQEAKESIENFAKILDEQGGKISSQKGFELLKERANVLGEKLTFRTAGLDPKTEEDLAKARTELVNDQIDRTVSNLTGKSISANVVQIGQRRKERPLRGGGSSFSTVQEIEPGSVFEKSIVESYRDSLKVLQNLDEESVNKIAKNQGLLGKDFAETKNNLLKSAIESINEQLKFAIDPNRTGGLTTEYKTDIFKSLSADRIFGKFASILFNTQEQTEAFEKRLEQNVELFLIEEERFFNRVNRDLANAIDFFSSLTSTKAFSSLALGEQTNLLNTLDISKSQQTFIKNLTDFRSQTAKKLLEDFRKNALTTGLTSEQQGEIENFIIEFDPSNIQAFNEELADFVQTLSGVDKRAFNALSETANSLSDQQADLLSKRQNELKLLEFSIIERNSETRAIQYFNKEVVNFGKTIVDTEKGIQDLNSKIKILDLQTDFDTAISDAFALSSRQALSERQGIELKSVSQKAGYEASIAEKQAKIDLQRTLYTKENIVALNRNTETLRELADIQSIAQESYLRQEQDRIANRFGELTGGENIGDLLTNLTPEAQSLQQQYKQLSNILNAISSRRTASLTGKGGFGSQGTDQAASFKSVDDMVKGYQELVAKGQSPEQAIQSYVQSLGYSEESTIIVRDALLEYSRTLDKENNGRKNLLTETEKAQKLEAEKNILLETYAAALSNQIKSADEALKRPMSAGQFAAQTRAQRTSQRMLQISERGIEDPKKLRKENAVEYDRLTALNNPAVREYMSSFGYGFDEAMGKIEERTLDFRNQLGKEIPDLFSSNLAQGLNDAISGAKDLKTALTDAATAFFQEITRKNISNLADMVTGGIGGFFTKKASGGLISGGSGTKDDVPAMLMGGEYVVKKSAVSKYGKGFLDAINSGSMRGYATGGMVDPQTFPTQTGRGGFYTPGDYGQGAITGKNELLTFASQSFTSGQYDYMGGIGMGGATVSLEPESARLSALGREGSPMFERVQQSKDEAFRVYLEGLQKEKEYSELLDQIAKDKKARKKQLQMAIISAVASTALSYAGSVGMTGAKNAVATASKTAAATGKTFGAGAKFMAGAKGFFTGSGGQGGLANIFKGTGTQLSDLVIANQNAKLSSSSNSAWSDLIKAYPQYKNAKFSGNYTYRDGAYRAAGGLISGGSNVRDDVPAMLTGGEFVLNNRATQRLGVQNLNKLNSGASVSSEGSSAEMTQALVSKLDELIQATSNSSKENVVVNVSTSEAGNQTSENPAGAEKELHKKIRQAVLDVIAQEKRLGGSLEKSR